MDAKVSSYSPWVKKVLTHKLTNSGGNAADNRWMDHALVMVKELKGQLLGALERNQIEWLHDVWSEKAIPYLDADNLHPDAKASIRSDITWIRQARICLDKLVTKEAEEEEKVIANKNAPQPKHPELDLKKNAESIPRLGVLATNNLVKDTNLEHENNGVVASIKLDLLDPNHVESAEQFLARIDAARKELFESKDAFDHKKIEGLAQIFQTLASTLGLGREFESLGQKLRYETYFRAAPLRPPKREGRPRKDDPPKEPDPWSATDHWYMDLLAKLSQEEFEKRLNEAIKDGSLSIRTFRIHKTPEISGHNAKSSSQATQDPLRFLVAFAADVRVNPDYYSPQNALKFSEDSRILENLGPVASEFLHFCATLGSEVRKKVEGQ